MTSRYPHRRTPSNPLLRLVWWAGQTGTYYHAPCGQWHVPGECLDGVDRNDPAYRRILTVIDYPPFVALFRLAGVVLLLLIIAAVFR